MTICKAVDNVADRIHIREIEDKKKIEICEKRVIEYYASETLVLEL